MMGAIVAARFNSVIRVFYQRLQRAGKGKKVALTACMRKLLTILNAMLKHRTPLARGGGIPCLNLKTVADTIFFTRPHRNQLRWPRCNKAGKVHFTCPPFRRIAVPSMMLVT